MTVSSENTSMNRYRRSECITIFATSIQFDERVEKEAFLYVHFFTV